MDTWYDGQASLKLGGGSHHLGILRLTEVKDYSKRKKEKDNSYEMFKSFDKNTLCTITTEFNITCI